MLLHLFLKVSSVLLYLDCVQVKSSPVNGRGMCSGASLRALAPTASVTDSSAVQTPHTDLEGIHGLHSNMDHQNEP